MYFKPLTQIERHSRDVDKSRQPEKESPAIPKKFPADESWKDDTPLPKYKT